MRSATTLIAIGLAAALHAAPAAACRTHWNVEPFFHSETSVPDGADFVAEVEITRVVALDEGLSVPAYEARVIRHVRGEWQGNSVRIPSEVVWNSCSSYPETGDTGMLVGKIVTQNGDEIVIDLIRAPSLREQELQAQQPN